ncbi:unnamed protein product [Callosobruchus maculatus]|uniref:Uncharacterized protein n=1 Tax=Callosobruchus maculatus TaxID=64391 RepID=A0A653CYG5_CALMS|nr:unnamed protein product [Callosobruchus maculatus]
MLMDTSGIPLSLNACSIQLQPLGKCCEEPFIQKIVLWAESKAELVELQKKCYLEQHQLKLQLMREKHKEKIRLMKKESDVKIELWNMGVPDSWLKGLQFITPRLIYF